MYFTNTQLAKISYQLTTKLNDDSIKPTKKVLFKQLEKSKIGPHTHAQHSQKTYVYTKVKFCWVRKICGGESHAFHVPRLEFSDTGIVHLFVFFSLIYFLPLLLWLSRSGPSKGPSSPSIVWLSEQISEFSRKSFHTLMPIKWNPEKFSKIKCIFSKHYFAILRTRGGQRSEKKNNKMGGGEERWKKWNTMGNGYGREKIESWREALGKQRANEKVPEFCAQRKF